MQKNPGNIRTAEENRGVTNKTLGILLYVPKAYEISKHVTTMCADALDSTYTSYSDLELWSSSAGKENIMYTLIMKKLLNHEGINFLRLFKYIINPSIYSEKGNDIISLQKCFVKSIEVGNDKLVFHFYIQHYMSTVEKTNKIIFCKQI